MVCTIETLAYMYYIYLQENITALDGEIAEEREKCQEMVAGKKSEIEAYATEVYAPLSSMMYIYPLQ